MRRGMIAMAGTAVCVLLLAIFFQDLEGRTGVLRYQQHREQPSETELGPCPVCGGRAELCTHLPIIRIETGGQTIPGRPYRNVEKGIDEYYTGDFGEEEIHVDFSTVSEEGIWHHVDDTPTDEGTALFRYRGNSSRWFIKGSYLFKLTERDNPELRVSSGLLGMYPGSEWVLHGPCLDRTLIRNYLCYNISGQVMGYAPNCRFCELYIDEDYQGVYLLTEAIAKGDGRIELTEPNSSGPMTSWMIRLDRDFKCDVPLDSFGHYTFRLEDAQADLLYPGKNTVTPERIKYVNSELSYIERLLYSYNISDGSKDYQDYVDVTAFAQYYILNEFFGNVDAGRFSTYYYKDIRGKMTPVVWDFNNAADNYINYPYEEYDFYVSRMPFLDRFMTDEDFTDEVIRQYRSLRKTYLSDENLIQMIDGAVSYLGSAVERNNERWSSLYDLSNFPEESESYLAPVTRNYVNYEDSVDQLERWLISRGRWMDEHIDSLRQYCHPSRFANQMLG